MNATVLWVIAVILAIVGIVQLLQGQVIFGIILLIVAAAVGPGGLVGLPGPRAYHPVPGRFGQDGGVDLGDDPEEAAFRAEARAWLAAHVGPYRVDVDPDSPSLVFADVSDLAHLERGPGLAA